MTIIHILKCWPRFYDAISAEAKTWEVRKNDRGFHVGDIIVLRPWDPSTQTYLPAGEIRVRITYLSDLTDIGLRGYVGMSIRLEEEQ